MTHVLASCWVDDLVHKAAEITWNDRAEEHEVRSGRRSPQFSRKHVFARS